MDKLLAAAKAVLGLEQTVSDLSGSHAWGSLRAAIREAEAAPTPKPDPWVCCHGTDDFGRCGAESCGWRDKVQSFYPITSCPCNDRQKPAPPRRTKLDAAVEGYTNDAEKHCYQRAYESPMRAALEAIGVNPDSEVEG